MASDSTSCCFGPPPCGGVGWVQQRQERLPAKSGGQLPPALNLLCSKFRRGYFWGYFEIFKSKNLASMRVAEEDMKDILPLAVSMMMGVRSLAARSRRQMDSPSSPGIIRSLSLIHISEPTRPY